MRALAAIDDAASWAEELGRRDRAAAAAAAAAAGSPHEKGTAR